MNPAFTAVFGPQPSGWIVASIAEVPGVNTQGRTMEEARENLADALAMVLEANRELALAETGAETRIESLAVPLLCTHSSAAQAMASSGS